MIENSFSDMQRALLFAVREQNNDIHQPVTFIAGSRKFRVNLWVNERQASIQYQIFCTFITSCTESFRQLEQGLNERYYQQYLCATFAPVLKPRLSEIKENFVIL